MRKMIAFQKMMLTICFCLNDNQSLKRSTEETAEYFIFCSCFIPFLFLINKGIFFGYFVCTLPFLANFWNILRRDTFLLNLPLKRKFSITGIYLNNAIIIVGCAIAMNMLFAFIDCISHLISLLNGYQTLPINLSFTQETLLMSAFFLVYINAITLFLFSKRFIIRIIGTAIFSALYYLVILELSNEILKTDDLKQYLRTNSTGWVLIGLAFLFVVIITAAEVQLSVWIDRYNRKHPKIEKRPAQ
jgi:hypothetical protein